MPLTVYRLRDTQARLGTLCISVLARARTHIHLEWACFINKIKEQIICLEKKTWFIVEFQLGLILQNHLYIGDIKIVAEKLKNIVFLLKEEVGL